MSNTTNVTLVSKFLEKADTNILYTILSTLSADARNRLETASYALDQELDHITMNQLPEEATSEQG